MEIQEEKNNIVIKGARVNNLKDVSLEIPRGKFVVITGISGSGKSSLAFDTLYAEGQRRFAESLSSYARQFLGRMSKPDVDSIEGIAPAVAIEQKVNVKNPRSTVATTTEIYDYLRLVYARTGHTISPVSGREVRKDSVSDVFEYMNSLGSAAYVLADINWSAREDKVELMLGLKEDGFSRLWMDGAPIKIDEVLQMDGKWPEQAWLLVDRAKAPFDRDRMIASVTSAFSRGDGRLTIATDSSMKEFSTRFELDGMIFREPDEYLFSFNSPLGACPTCGGLGKIIGISEDLVIPDKTKSIYDGAIACWRGEKMGWFRDLIVKNAAKYGIDAFKPYCKLSQREKDIIWHERHVEGDDTSIVGLDEFFEWVETQRYKIQYKYMLSRFSGRTTCHDCHGSRLRKEALWVKVGGRSIDELLDMNIEECISFFQSLQLTENEHKIADGPINEILTRLECLKEVGLSYLTLSRACNTLSGGESQRINLVTSLGNSLVGSMYILDEPSIGLHSRDTQRLIRVLRRLRDLGNTVVVVEHDEEIIRAADYLIDMGPRAGIFGGEIVFKGENTDNVPEEEVEKSLTLQYLYGRRPRLQRQRREWQYSIKVEGAMEHNLKDIDVTFPLGTLTVVTGVSGSGKSSLVGDILYPALYRQLNESGDKPGVFRRLSGNFDRISRVEYVDQNPIGKSTRSNAVTYLKVYDDIRKLLSLQQYARINGYGANYFSFNSDGGRCPECQGEGMVKIEMQFMSDVKMLCEECGGKRFKADVLEVRFKGRNADDILSMSVDEAIEFFAAGAPEKNQDELSKQIAARLQTLKDVGLGYIKLGQSSSTLSGGESQRIKLAYFLSLKETTDANKGKIMFIFDEPTTGLHFYDVEKLLKSFDVLLKHGHSLVVVEHNVDVIKAADWVIDLGPDAGDRGGNVVFCGTPENLKNCKESFTAKYL